VYPEFAVQDGRLLPQHGAELHEDLAKFPSEVTGDRLAGFGPVVSTHDLGSATLVHDVFAEYGVRTRFATDEQVIRQGGRMPLVAFGLRSNNLTTFYLRDQHALFRTEMDDIFHLVLRSGEEFLSTPPIWRGVVAGVTPQPKEAPNRRWFFCSGLGGVGTLVAGGYLSNYWKTLHDEAGGRDFVAVVAGHELNPIAGTLEALDVR
jgi:hypothetical protein